jgi:hypothetical protein
MNMDQEHQRFVTIDYFVIEMLGFRSRSTYYNHVGDPGWPQRVYPTGKPMLVYDECVAYQKMLMDQRDEPPVMKRLVVKRSPGRPKKKRAA